MWLAQAVSLTGDQLARVAIAALVFDRTGSAWATSAVYAITLLPWLIGGPLLGGLGDRFPRRRVMLCCRVGSAALVAVMAVPSVPVAADAVLLFVVVLLEPPFLSARAALLLDVLPDDRYVMASSVGQVTSQATQVLGFAAGGALVAVMGARNALLLDAGTFAVAVVLVRAFVRVRPAAAGRAVVGNRGWRRIAIGASLVFGDRWLRSLALLAWLAAFWVVPEALAAPLAAGQPRLIGLLLAAQPAGAVVGGTVLARLVRPETRLRLMGPLAILASAPLLLVALRPPVILLLILLAVSGLGTACNLPANAAFMQAVPKQRRSQAFGLVSAGLIAGQGLGIMAAGGLTQLTGSPYPVIAFSGLCGTIAATLLALRVMRSALGTDGTGDAGVA